MSEWGPGPRASSVAASEWGAGLLVELYARYARELAAIRRFDPLIPAIGDAYAGEERRVLYMMTRHHAPGVIVEFSPKRGWTTLHMALALEHTGRGRIVSFELDPLLAWVTRRTLRRAGLAQRVEVVEGDVRERLPRVCERLARDGVGGLEFVFIDSAHTAAFGQWYLATVFPVLREGAVIHVHDMAASPERVARGEAIVPAPTGEERVLAAYLVDHADRYRWFSLAELVSDRAYVASVRPHGGGDLTFPPGRLRYHPIDRAAGRERNPALWIQHTAPQEAHTCPTSPIEPFSGGFLDCLARNTRRHLAFAYGPLRERRRLARLRARAAAETPAAAPPPSSPNVLR